MSQLTQAADALGITVDTSLAGSLITICGKHRQGFIVEMPGQSHFFIWCDDPNDRVVEHADNPFEAIRTALRRIDRISGDRVEMSDEA